ncbi:MAG: TetR/AcrR family transcriptional regulator [Gammaproteobacteria bacterium]|nr:TetR/AcrR family transcriptional regulator [Gammaproteobacteria bacterium]
MSSQTAASIRTREALILAGEQLFGERGIDGVSLRQINTAAGQKNSSAAHYHFGSKEALVGAVYDYRMESVNRRRLEMLQRLEEAEQDRDVRAIVEAIVLPIVAEIQNTTGGSHYIRFMAQVIGHPQISLVEIWNSRFAEGLARVIELLRAALPEVPAEILGQRFGLMWEQTIHALADRERLSEGGNTRRMVEPELFVSNLIDTVAGGLSAPVSPKTRNQLGSGGLEAN